MWSDAGSVWHILGGGGEFMDITRPSTMSFFTSTASGTLKAGNYDKSIVPRVTKEIWVTATLKKNFF